MASKNAPTTTAASNVRSTIAEDLVVKPQPKVPRRSFIKTIGAGGVAVSAGGGPKKLPELGKGIGDGIRSFKSAIKQSEDSEKATAPCVGGS